MRYLITILAISAFALMAGSAQAYDDRFGPKDDDELPAQSGFTVPAGVYTNVSWQIDFVRTDKSNATKTRVLIKIDDTNVQGDSSPVEEWIDSEDYSEGAGSHNGSDTITGSTLRGKMELSSDKNLDETGHFEDMYLGYTRFNP